MNQQNQYPKRQNADFSDKDNHQSFLTDDKTNTEIGEDGRVVENADQEGFGMDDGPNQPLSKEMLDDLQDVGQRELQKQREEEKKG
ncbi:MAG: hypothetical protein MUD08_02735 [Cytophagales bacterium]|jgi:hypothetical protein|nr:hypothetical protein [Cytophagales bacterium]